jgi:hypothetical protein
MYSVFLCLPMVLCSSDFFVEFSGDIAKFSVAPRDTCEFCLKLWKWPILGKPQVFKKSGAIPSFWVRKGV